MSYIGVDKYNRVIGAIALLSKNTLPRITEKSFGNPCYTNFIKYYILIKKCGIIIINQREDVSLCKK